MSVCDPCKKAPHTSQPEECRGSTWCDCQHRIAPKPIVYAPILPETVIEIPVIELVEPIEGKF